MKLLRSNDNVVRLYESQMNLFNSLISSHQLYESTNINTWLSIFFGSFCIIRYSLASFEAFLRIDVVLGL